MRTLQPQPDPTDSKRVAIPVARLEEVYRTLRAFSHELRDAGYARGGRLLFHAAKVAEGYWRRAKKRAEKRGPKEWQACDKCNGTLAFVASDPMQSPGLTCTSCGVIAHFCCDLPLSDKRLVAFRMVSPCPCGCHEPLHAP
jgi:hypothetical protein